MFEEYTPTSFRKSTACKLNKCLRHNSSFFALEDPAPALHTKSKLSITNADCVFNLQLRELDIDNYGSLDVPFIAPAFFVPGRLGGLSPTKHLHSLTIMDMSVTDIRSLLASVGGKHHLTTLSLSGVFESSEESVAAPDMCDLTPCVSLQCLKTLAIERVGVIERTGLDAVLQACKKLTELSLASYKMSGPLQAGSASISKINLGANPLYEHAEMIDMSLFPSLQSVEIMQTMVNELSCAVPMQNAGQVLERMRSAVLWPVTTWWSLSFQGLAGGSPELQAQYASEMSRALLPLAESAAARCLVSLTLDGDKQSTFFNSSTITSLAAIFPNVRIVRLQHPNLDARPVFEVLKAFPHISELEVRSEFGSAGGLNEGVVAACTLALYTHLTPLVVHVQGGSLSGIAASWKALCAVQPDIGNNEVSIHVIA